MDATLPTWSSAALAYLPPEGALPAWWTRAEEAGWSTSTLASALAMVAPVTRRVYAPSGDRYEPTTRAGAVTEVSATHLGGTLPTWDPVAEAWVDQPWRWTHPSARTSLEGEGESLAALLWRRSRELSAGARAA